MCEITLRLGINRISGISGLLFPAATDNVWPENVLSGCLWVVFFCEGGQKVVAPWRRWLGKFETFQQTTSARSRVYDR